MKGWKKIYPSNSHPKQAGIAVLPSDTVDFKPKLVRKDKDSHFILIKGKIHQEELTIVNLYAPNCQCTQLHQISTIGLKNTDRPQQSDGGRH
jgi:hypothetical protein